MNRRRRLSLRATSRSSIESIVFFIFERPVDSLPRAFVVLEISIGVAGFGVEDQNIGRCIRTLLRSLKRSTRGADLGFSPPGRCVTSTAGADPGETQEGDEQQVFVFAAGGWVAA